MHWFACWYSIYPVDFLYSFSFFFSLLCLDVFKWCMSSDLLVLSSIWSSLLLKPYIVFFYFCHCILQLQNFCLVLFYHFYFIVELILFMYWFTLCSWFTLCLSVFSHCSQSFFKTIIYTYLPSNLQISIYLVWLLESYWVTMVVPCFPSFSCSL